MNFFVQHDENGKAISKILYMGDAPPSGFTEITQEEYDTTPIEKEKTYEDLRRDAYPPISDQLDALWKGGADQEAMKQVVLAVKEKYPKDK